MVLQADSVPSHVFYLWLGQVRINVSIKLNGFGGLSLVPVETQVNIKKLPQNLPQVSISAFSGTEWQDVRT